MTRTRSSDWSTTLPTDSPARSGLAISVARCAWREASRPAYSVSTAAGASTRRRPSAATSAAASVASSACTGSSSTRKSRTSSSVSSRQEGFVMARTVTPARERSTTTRADRTNGQSRRQEKTAKLTLEELVRQTKAGEVDTVIIAIADLQGRLMGKRLTGPYFLDHVDEGLHACDYLLAMDVDNEPLPGFKFSNWGTGYGDMHGHPDLSTIRRLPWLEKTALILCDVETMGGKPVDVAPRQILRRQVERARKLGVHPKTGSALECYLFKDSSEQAAEKDYRNLQPYGRYIEDYHILQGTKAEWFNRLVRNGMEGAAVPGENSKGEGGVGQQEINLRFAESLEMADRHVIYKNGVKEIAALNQVAVTFMAKWTMAQAGSSFHLHSSLWDVKSDKALFHSANGGPHGMSTLFQHYLAG